MWISLIIHRQRSLNHMANKITIIKRLLIVHCWAWICDYPFIVGNIPFEAILPLFLVQWAVTLSFNFWLISDTTSTRKRGTIQLVPCKFQPYSQMCTMGRRVAVKSHYWGSLEYLIKIEYFVTSMLKPTNMKCKHTRDNISHIKFYCVE